ncbi:MAG: hypothetical protein RQ723_06215 [Desulfuromonadales bacterium]|nr:hypothetical protein [Desulfuromonadales bacterium]
MRSALKTLGDHATAFRGHWSAPVRKNLDLRYPLFILIRPVRVKEKKNRKGVIPHVRHKHPSASNQSADSVSDRRTTGLRDDKEASGAEILDDLFHFVLAGQLQFLDGFALKLFFRGEINPLVEFLELFFEEDMFFMQLAKLRVFFTQLLNQGLFHLRHARLLGSVLVNIGNGQKPSASSRRSDVLKIAMRPAIVNSSGR